MNWYKKIASLVLYHRSDISPSIILQQGLQKASQGLTQAGSWAEEEAWIPNNCIYLSNNIKQWPGKYVYAVNVDGLQLFPDFPSIVDKGAYINIDNGYLYWKNDSDIPMQLIDKHNDYGIYREYITWEDSIIITGNVCVAAPIEPARIKIIPHELV